MKMKNSGDNHEALSTDLSDDDPIHSMAELAIDSLKEEYKTEWEPFELYAQKLQSHVHANPKQFHENFKKGYETLLEGIKIRDKG